MQLYQSFNFLQFLTILLTQKVLFVSTAAPSGQQNDDKTDLNTLRHVQVILRHGQRNPYIEYPKDPLNDEKIYSEGFNKLTKEGRAQMNQLGQYLRQRYDGYLNKQYSSSEIFVDCSNLDRSITSALSTLSGLYPPTENSSDLKNWQTIPIHTIPSLLDNYIYFTAKCPRNTQLDKEFAQDSKLARKINSENLSLYKYVAKKTGLIVEDFRILSYLYDTLVIQKFNNLTLPKWTEKIWLKLQKLEPFPYDFRIQVPTRESMRIKCGPLMTKLISNMEKRIKLLKSGPPKPKIYREFNAIDLDDVRDKAGRSKMYVISGHDSTVSIFLGTLRLFTYPQLSSYASSVFIEMHELPQRIAVSTNFTLDSATKIKTKKGENYFVKIFHRNDTALPPYELTVPNCGYPCKLNKFKNLYEDLILTRRQWKRSCRSKKNI